MPDSKRFLHPDAIRRISRLDLRAKQIVEGFLSGTHRSPYFGQSVEFLQHREYVSGDDLRHVDWKVWARQDRYYVKQYEEETNLRCYFLVDRSSSMKYGSGTFSKYEFASTLAACLAYLVIRQHDAAACMTFDSQIRDIVPASSGRTQLMVITDVLDSGPSSDEKTDLGLVLNKAAEAFPKKGLIVLISDLFGNPDSMLKSLRRLKKQGHEISVLQIMDDDEVNFEFSGPIRFEDLELDSKLNCNPRALRDGYLAALDEFLQQVRRGCSGASVDYTMIRTSQNIAAVLSEFLTRRLARIRKRSK